MRCCTSCVFKHKQERHHSESLHEAASKATVEYSESSGERMLQKRIEIALHPEKPTAGRGISPVVHFEENRGENLEDRTHNVSAAIFGSRVKTRLTAHLA